MPGQRDDYILRAIDQLRQLVSQAVKLRDTGKLDQALLAIVTAQERLFARPAPQFMGLSLDEQLRLLKLGESPDSARAKCLGYAVSLREAGVVYEARDKRDVAIGAFQSALYITLIVALENKASIDELRETLADLLARIPPDQLQAPTQALLAQVSAIG
jgi:hypothetical protein